MTKSNKQKLIPKLRFPEFKNEGEWREELLENVLDYERPDNYIVTNTNYQNDGTPVLTANKSFILGYTKENEGIYRNLPAIIFDDFTVDSKFVDFPFKIKSSAIKILTTKKDDDLRFTYELISQIKFNASEHKRYYISEYQKLKLPFPKPAEQQKIASCISSLDEVISAHSQKLELLKDHKKGLMQNLFPQRGQKIPNFRFPEFKNDGAWVEKKLGDKDVAFIVNEKISIEELNASTYISTENMLAEFTGVSNASNLPLSGKFTKFKNDDILISNIRPYLKKVWRANKTGGSSNDVIVFRTKEKVISDFLEFIIKNEAFINYVMESAKGVKMPRGDKDSMLQYPVFIPSKKEQQKIASCLSTVDELITVQKAKIEQLKLHKKGLMQGLFPKMSE